MYRAPSVTPGASPHAAERRPRVEDRFEREIGGELEGHVHAAEKAVSGIEQHRLGHAFDNQPALAGEHGVALDSLMLGKANGHVAQHRKAAGDVNLRLHQGKNLGERVHTLTRSQVGLAGAAIRVFESRGSDVAGRLD